MFNSSVIDVALGLALVYLLLSLICTASGEIIEARLKMRSKQLERGIFELLTDRDKQGKAITWAQHVYAHPLITGLSEHPYSAADRSKDGKLYDGKADLPSYIPRQNFALVLMEVLVAADRATLEPGESSTLAEDRAAAITFDGLRQAVVNCPIASVRRSVLPLVDVAHGDVIAARRNIEAWYDGMMDRVSGWYKRHSQRIVLVVAAVVTIALNADTIALVTTLSRDPNVRASLVRAAEATAQAPTNPFPDPESPIAACREGGNAAECSFQRNVAQINRLDLPLGWNTNDERLVPRSLGGWLLKLLGLLISVGAASLGAPFWFDVLNKIMVVRSTVKPREKSQDEPAVDGPKNQPIKQETIQPTSSSDIDKPNEPEKKDGDEGG